MIMACLDAAPGDVPCYTFGSMYRETLDVSIGRQVAAHCRQPHAVLELGRDFLRGFATTLDQAVLISDGYLGVSGAAELHVNRAARTIAPVRMTGNWGGELLRGVRAFKYLQPTGAFLSDELMQHLR
jgi:asparagine synthase (glutamine-hydrolysing)